MNKRIYELLKRNALDCPKKLAFADDSLEIDWQRAFRIVLNISREINAKFQDHNIKSAYSGIVVRGDCSVVHVLLIYAIILNRMVYIPHNRTLDRNSGHQFNELPHLVVSKNAITFLEETWTIENFDSAENLNPEILESYEVAAAFYYTSGTTGVPKVIVNSDSNILRGAKFVTEALDLKSDDIFAGTLLLDFDYGVNQIFCNLYLGATYIVAPFSSTNVYWVKMVQKYRPTIVPVMPFLIENYFIQESDLSFESVRLCTSSGAPLTKEHALKILNLFPKAEIIPMYGLSEGFRATITPPGEYGSRPASVGKPIGDTQIRIVKNGFEECGPMEVGEIIQASGCTSWGYFSDLSSTEEKFIRDPDFPNRLWIRSGDLGYLDLDNYLYVIGRVESQIKLFGIRISIDEIESRYKQIPGVQNAVVIPIEVNETESEFGVAIVADLTLAEIKKATHALPREYKTNNIRLIPEIIGNYNGGKPDRTSIFERYFRD